MRFAPGASRWAAVPLLAGGIAGVYRPQMAVVGVVLALGVLLFFRDPERVPPARGVVSPADGTVSVVRVEDHDGADCLRVGVFMNVWNVHVNRAPVAGEVLDVTHESGAHRPAFSKDSDRNERVRVTVESDGEAAGPPVEYEVALVAGAFARRITPYVEAGDVLARGDRIGHIAFGSRVDVLFPPGVERSDLAVGEGDAVRAGESVLVGDPP